MRRILIALVALAAAPPALRAGLPVPDPDDGAIKLPPGFRALVVADNLGPLRFLTVAPNGDVYVKRACPPTWSRTPRRRPGGASCTSRPARCATWPMGAACPE